MDGIFATEKSFMTTRLTLGVINHLIIDRETPHGLFLRDEQGDDVLLPQRYVLPFMQVGNFLDVFVSTDSEDRLVATTTVPSALRDQFGYYQVIDTTPFGAFVDWGMPKDLFVPKICQKTPFQRGEWRIVRVVEDEQTQRLIGDERITRYIDPLQRPFFPKHHEVKLMILARTPLGYKAIINDVAMGMLYHNEIFEDLAIGEVRTGYIKQVRHDGKIDLSLQPLGDGRFDVAHEKVVSTLQSVGGKLPLTPKSDPDTITQTFGISKKNFKHAVSTLQKEGRLRLTDEGIELV